MDRVASELQAALLQENYDIVKKKFAILRENLLRKTSNFVDVLDLCYKGVLNKCFSVYGCIPSSLSSNYIPIR